MRPSPSLCRTAGLPCRCSIRWRGTRWRVRPASKARNSPECGCGATPCSSPASARLADTKRPPASLLSAGERLEAGPSRKCAEDHFPLELESGVLPLEFEVLPVDPDPDVPDAPVLEPVDPVLPEVPEVPDDASPELAEEPELPEPSVLVLPEGE